MRNFAAILATVLSVFTLCSCGRNPPSPENRPKVIYDETYGVIRLEAVLVNPGYLSQQTAQKIGTEFVRTVGLNGFSELIIADDYPELIVSTRGTVPAIESEESFERTLEQLKSASGGRTWGSRPIARVVVFGGAALLSYRAGGRGNPKLSGVEESLLAGNYDPTITPVDGTGARLLKLSVKSRSQSTSPDVAAFYKVKEALSCRSCRELAQYTRTLSRSASVEVQARQDIWFASLFFPVLFRFEPDNQPMTYTNLSDHMVPPSIVQYYRTPQTACRLTDGGFSCQRYGVVERIP